SECFGMGKSLRRADATGSKDLGRTAPTWPEGVFHSFHNRIVKIPLVDGIGNGKHIHETAPAREHHLLVIDRVASIAAQHEPRPTPGTVGGLIVAANIFDEPSL